MQCTQKKVGSGDLITNSHPLVVSPNHCIFPVPYLTTHAHAGIQRTFKAIAFATGCGAAYFADTHRRPVYADYCIHPLLVDTTSRLLLMSYVRARAETYEHSWKRSIGETVMSMRMKA